MIELGKIQKLQVIRNASIGVYLNSKYDKSKDDVLLPQKQVPSETKIGDEIEVFVYRDSKDRMISTINMPKITIGKLAHLKVIETTKFGAFLDWGLEKDLFLPFKEQANKVQKGRKYLVSLYIDKSDRLCATMNIYKLLSDNAPYKENDKVEGIIYNIKKDMGAFVAIDKKYHGLIPRDELHKDIRCGDEVEARISKVREDGKLYLSLRKKAYKQMDVDAKIIIDRLIGEGGILMLDDNSSPVKIKDELNMSKRAFKRGVGRLLKEGKIEFVQGGIKLN